LGRSYNFGGLDRHFAGRADCFGLYIFDGAAPPAGKKREGRAISYPNSTQPDRKLVDKDWDNHVRGNSALGIVPVLTDGTTKWFSIDVDNYELNHTELARKIAKFQFPIVHCRSKSGGAHLYCLISEPVSAKSCVDLARKWCTFLGFDPKKTEVFPKQTKFDSPEAKGNWIIIPYFGGPKAEDYAIDEDGKKVKFEDFEQYCDSRTITPAEFEELVAAKNKGKEKKVWSQDEIDEQTPPCIMAMKNDHLKEGDGRNNAASHLTWFFRKLDEFFDTGDWQEKLEDFNNNYFDPPLSYKEFSQVIKNHSKGKYVARCTVNPMATLCDKETCVKLKFGVGKDKSFYGDVEITSITKIETGDDPLWRVYINGQHMTISTEQLLSPRLFRIAVLSNFNIVIPVLKQADHDAIIAPLIHDALVIEYSELISTGGKVFDAFKTWVGVTGDKSYSKQHVIKQGLPYILKDEAIIFRLNDFVLEYRRIYREMTADKEVYVALKAFGFYTKQYMIDNKLVTLMELKIEGTEDWLPKLKEEGKF